MKIAVILAIIGVIVGILFYSNSENEKKMRLEAAALAEQVAYAESQYAKIAESLTGIEELGPEVRAVMTAASNVVPSIVGADNAARVYDKDFGKKKATVSAVTPVVVKTADDVKKDAVKVGIVKDEMGRDAPAGYATKEMERKQSALDLEKKEAMSAASTVADSGSTGNKLEDRITKCREYLENIREHCAMVDAQIAEGRRILDESKTILGRVKSATTAFNAVKPQAGFAELVPMAKDLRAGIKQEIVEAAVIPAKLEDMKAEVEEEKRAAEAAAEKVRLAREKEANRQLENSMAGGWYNGKAEMLKVFQFAAAAESVKSLQNALTFEEARVGLEMPLERYTLMDEVMKYIQASFNKAPMAWGWKTATGALDIQKADADGIYVQEQLIKWTDIPKDRIASFFTHYLKASESVGKSKANLYIGAALFCKTYGLPGQIDAFLDQARIESELAAKGIDGLMNFKPDASLAH